MLHSSLPRSLRPDTSRCSCEALESFPNEVAARRLSPSFYRGLAECDRLSPSPSPPTFARLCLPAAIPSFAPVDAMTKIIDVILEKSSNGTPFFSFEYFPPKTEEGLANLFERQSRMQALGPAFCDITWGAGGTTSELTLEISAHMQNKVREAARGCGRARRGGGGGRPRRGAAPWSRALSAHVLAFLAAAAASADARSRSRADFAIRAPAASRSAGVRAAGRFGLEVGARRGPVPGAAAEGRARDGVGRQRGVERRGLRAFSVICHGVRESSETQRPEARAATPATSPPPPHSLSLPRPPAPIAPARHRVWHHRARPRDLGRPWDSEHNEPLPRYFLRPLLSGQTSRRSAPFPRPLPSPPSDAPIPWPRRLASLFERLSRRRAPPPSPQPTRPCLALPLDLLAPCSPSPFPFPRRPVCFLPFSFPDTLFPPPLPLPLCCRLAC